MSGKKKKKRKKKEEEEQEEDENEDGEGEGGGEGGEGGTRDDYKKQITISINNISSFLVDVTFTLRITSI